MFEDIIHYSLRTAAVIAAVICIRALSKPFLGEDGQAAISKKKKLIITVSVIFAVVIFVTVREINLRKAEYRDGSYEFDGMIYEEIDYKVIEPYTETWNVICRTKDGSRTVYEIKEYPDREYAFARIGRDGCVIKLTEKQSCG